MKKWNKNSKKSTQFLFAKKQKTLCSALGKWIEEKRLESKFKKFKIKPKTSVDSGMYYLKIRNEIKADN